MASSRPRVTDPHRRRCGALFWQSWFSPMPPSSRTHAETHFNLKLTFCCLICLVHASFGTTISSAVHAAPQGRDHSEERARLAAEEEVQTSTQRRHHHPVWVQTRARQAAAEAAEDRSSLRRTPEEPQHGHGEQDRPAAEEDG